MIGKNGLDLIKHFESCRLNAFKPIPTDPWTIGWGRTAGVKEYDHCTQAEANAWLEQDVGKAAGAIARGVSPKLTNNQFGALASFIYNVGETAFWSSTLRRLLNEGKPAEEVAEQFLRWDKSKGVPLAGLARRRQAEKRLFLTPDNEEFSL